jgi:arylamine N-acetyltransferase
MKDGHVSIAVAPEEGRLIKGNIPASADRDQTFWIYQYGSSAKNEWSTAYAFSETEFFREDYDVMNFYTSQHPTSSFVQGFIVSRFLLSEEKDDIIGWLMIGKDLVKRNIKGQVEVVQTLASEEERVDALDKLFNMHLEPMEIRGIQSLRTELGAQ